MVHKTFGSLLERANQTQKPFSFVDFTRQNFNVFFEPAGSAVAQLLNWQLNQTCRRADSRGRVEWRHCPWRTLQLIQNTEILQHYRQYSPGEQREGDKSGEFYFSNIFNPSLYHHIWNQNIKTLEFYKYFWFFNNYWIQTMLRWRKHILKVFLENTQTWTA